MTAKTALLALLTVWGVGSPMTLPVLAEDAPPAEVDSGDDAEESPKLTDRVWVRVTTGDDLPGPMHIFLSDGTLVTDSCWETYRFSEWKAVDERNVTWNEDGMDITAEILSLSADELVLSVKLVGGSVEERYTLADVPYVCPDMPR